MKRLPWMLILGLVLACGLAVSLAAEFADDPPRTGAAALAIAPRNPIEPSRNAFFALYGLFSPPGTDPNFEGLALAEAYAAGRANATVSFGGRAPLEVVSGQGLPPWLEPGEGRMIDSLRAEPELAAHLLGENAELLTRYRQLLGYPDFTEPDPADPTGPRLDYDTLRKAQNIWFMRVFDGLRRGDIGTALDDLGSDARLWRMVMTRAGSTISKMVALGLFRRDLLFLAEIDNYRLLRGPQRGQAEIIAAGFNHPELDFTACAASEMVWQTRLLARMRTDSALAAARLGPVRAVLLRPFLGQAKTRNLIAAGLLAAVSLAETPGAEFHAAFAAWERGRTWPSFGACGAGMVRRALLPDYAGLVYAVRRVDGLSRLVRLRLGLADLGLNGESDISAYLRAAPPALRDPFTGRPVKYEPGDGYIYFYDGQAPDPNETVTRVYLH